MSSSVEKVIIIWSGPAWHTAAIYAWRAMLEPLMFEGFLAWGVAAWGQLTTTTDVENYPGFPNGIMWPELMQGMREQSLHSGCRIETKTIERVLLSQDPKNVPHKVRAQWEDEPRLATTIIIATWATAKRLHLPGEDIYWQNGVSACAVCDGALPIFRKKHLVVIGGGDSACEEANYLTKYASKVTMLVRRDAMRASKVMQQRVFDNPKIEVLRNTQATDILGDGQVMTGLKILNNTSDEVSEIEAGGLFYAIGHKPATSFLDGQLMLDEAWYILTGHMLTGENNEVTWHVWNTGTSVPGVFAGGDVQDKKYRQAITSAGTWCMASLEAEHFLQ